MENKGKYEYDFKQFGVAIKKGRKRAGLTIEDLAEKVGVTPRYIAAIENEGKGTSVKTLLQIITYLHISIDEIIYPNTPSNNSQRIYINAMLDKLDANSIRITESLLKTLVDIKKDE